MKKAFVLTVPGTGTRFTRTFITDVLGYRHVRPEAFGGSGKLVTTAHAMHPTAFDNYFKAFTTGKAAVVSALRDPYLAGLSMPHGNRSKNPALRTVGPLPDSMKNRPVAQWQALMAAWDRLQAEGLTMPFMQVEETDEDKRRGILESIATHLDASYSQDTFDAFLDAWEPVGVSFVTPHKQEYLDSGTIGGETLTHLTFVNDWSGTKRAVTPVPPRGKPPPRERKGKPPPKVVQPPRGPQDIERPKRAPRSRAQGG